MIILHQTDWLRETMPLSKGDPTYMKKVEVCGSRFGSESIFYVFYNKYIEKLSTIFKI